MDFNQRVQRIMEPQINELRRLFLDSESTITDDEMMPLLRAIKDELKQHQQDVENVEPDDDDDVQGFPLDEIGRIIKKWIIKWLKDKSLPPDYDLDGLPDTTDTPDSLPYDGPQSLPSPQMTPGTIIPAPIHAPSFQALPSSLNMSGDSPDITKCCEMLKQLIDRVDQRTCAMQSAAIQVDQKNQAYMGACYANQGSGGGECGDEKTTITNELRRRSS